MTAPPPSPETQSNPGKPVAAKRKLRRFGWFRWTVGSTVLLVLPAALLTFLVWAVGTPAGTAWLLLRTPGIQFEQPVGSLLSGLSVKRIVIALPSGPADRVVIEAPRASALSLSPSGNARAWLRVHAATLSAERVSVQIAANDRPPKLPHDLDWPIEVEIDAMSLHRLDLPRMEALNLRNITGQLHLGASSGEVHRADALAFAIGPVRFGGQAQVGTTGSMPLQLQLAATQAADVNATATPLPDWARNLREDWKADLTASGPLARFQASLKLRAQGQSVDATADVAPTEPWPLPRLDAQTERLDLSALLTQAPATALSGEVRITPVANAVDGAAGTLSAKARMNNERPGRWDQQRLPLRSFAFDLRARPGALARFEVLNARASLASDKQDAGTVQGQGEWNAGALKLQASLDHLQPGLLDPRLPAVTVSGPVKLAAALGSGPPSVEVQAELDGHLNADAARAVRVRLAASGSADHLEVRELQARAGPAVLTLAGSAKRPSTQAPWHLNGKASVNDFDPLPWFPGASGSVWQRGPHRFNGETRFELDLPHFNERPENTAHWLERLPGIMGQVQLTMHDSLLAGVPFSGEASLKSAPNQPTQVAAHIDAAGNALDADGRWAGAAQGSQDQWSIKLKAPRTAGLAPWLALASVPAPWASPAGALDISARLDGRWPALRAQGSLSVQGLRAGEAALARGLARWSYAGETDAPFDIHAELADASWAQQQAASVNFDLKGTPSDHTLDLRAALNAAPPAWADTVLGNHAAQGNGRAQTLLQLQARGSFTAASGAAAAAPAQWVGSVQSFELRGNAKDNAALVRLRDVGLELQPGDAQQAASLILQSGRGEVLGAALRWERASWQSATALNAAQLDVQAELEPLAVAPLLARAQPAFGWGGDLRVAARIAIKSAPTVQADVVIERVDGDLSVTEEGGTQALQLTDLRVALNAKDGQWTLTQALAGKTLGVAAGAIGASVPPPARWPDANTPISGVLEARVANLGTWGAWVPPGWRLAGALRTSAAISGRLGAPEYTGDIRGTEIGVRNIVQGVNVTDGDVDIRLQGTNARIERFEAKAGTGFVRLEGGASLGEAPKAQLKVVADKFQLLGRVDRRVVASGSAQMQLDAKSLNLDGRLSVDEGLIDFTRGDAPTLSDDVRVSARPGAPEKPLEAPAPRSEARKVTVDLQVGLGNNLRVRGRGLDTLLNGDLRLTTPANKLAVNGTVRTAQGTYAAYGQKLSIDRGELGFSGVAENPRLDIIATRPNLEQTVGVAVTGTALNPRVRLFSEPEMADVDKLSWLVLGRASDGLGRTDTALLQRAAIGLLAGEGTGPTDQLINAIGLDEVSFRQTDGEVKETVVSLGKQLSRRWYVGYERSLNATTGNWQLIYRLAQRLTLRAQSGLDNSLDAIWTWRWQ